MDEFPTPTYIRNYERIDSVMGSALTLWATVGEVVSVEPRAGWAGWPEDPKDS